MSGPGNPRPLVSKRKKKRARNNSDEQKDFIAIMKINMLQGQQLRQEEMRQRQEMREEQARQREEDRVRREDERRLDRARQEAESKRHEQFMQMLMLTVDKGATQTPGRE